MSSQGPGHGHESAGAGSSGQKYGGFKPPHVATMHKRLAVAVGATAWFWMLYRAKQDGDVIIGLRKPWEHKGHAEKDPEFD
eukprot:EC713655.1.p1 GENE.EC713655.1~~EC713655.1.p1  ORF type:complete len:81 (+),score=1.87 EC713655.1:2-244(+)